MEPAARGDRNEIMAVQLLCAEVVRSENAGARPRAHVAAACLSCIQVILTKGLTICANVKVPPPPPPPRQPFPPSAMAFQARIGSHSTFVLEIRVL